ncbi:HK97-gp10 family putative phage morphogenesis protein [Consotaella salsifontis]|uniref:Phage protein, HK97 gp10 family n=1 Tax=Consotaella salsifontis TaxID=1365950 RepID=A0A1T4SDI0_9HYPH|nr:HK97-gp10 family putative phage morphogenesis protein [Consotaella salsifontis]SKA26350.1 phage protein, HK97 gp10 family [Consotaella salsifontis]
MADDGGLSKLQKRFAAIPEDVRQAGARSALKQAEAMAATMRRLAPEDSGDLRDSITVTPGGQSTPRYSQPGGSSVVPENAAAVTVGNSDVRYPHLVEYGTAKAPAQPYFWPAVRLHNKKAKAAIKSAIRRAVKKRGTS